MDGGVATARPWAALPGDRCAANRRILVAGVGYDNLRDQSAGPLALERLERLNWPAGVELEDLSAGAVHVAHALQAREPYGAAVFIGAAARGGPPGAVRVTDFRHGAASQDEIQARVAEAVTGVVSLDTLLTVLDHFGGLPERVVVVEVEPLDGGWGPEPSPPVLVALERVEDVVRSTVADLLT